MNLYVLLFAPEVRRDNILYLYRMLGQQGLKSLLGLDLAPGGPVLTIYSGVAGERLIYTCDFIFKHVLKVGYIIVQDIKEFETVGGFKINYSDQDITGALQIVPRRLIFEKGISAKKPVPVFKNNNIYFYENEQGFHMDIFSAVFYFISRYEEWQGYKADIHGRFEASESILFRNGFHLRPVVDSWILELRAALELMFRDLQFPAGNFRVLSTIDVDNLFAYRSKGFLRTAGAILKDILRLDFQNLKERALVVAGKKEDPLDIYDDVSEFCFNNQIPLVLFFLFRTGTRYDRTVDPGSKAFGKVFQTLKKNHALIGLHPSYHSAFSAGMLQAELNRLSESSSENISFSRQHYLRFDIKTTPGLLLASGIHADFTMGFASSPGFRAGTSFPFYYYDFPAEKLTDLLFVPFCAMDGAYTVYGKTDPAGAFNSLRELAMEVKKVNGLYITVFHERTFYDHLYPGFSTLYKNLILKLKEIAVS